MSKFKFSALSVLSAVLAGFFLVAVIYAAWQEPPALPPEENAKPPLSVGEATQYKSGALGIGGVIQGWGGLVLSKTVPGQGSALFQSWEDSSLGALGYINFSKPSNVFQLNSQWNLNLAAGGQISMSPLGAGNLVNVNGNLTGTGYLKASQLCIEADCRASWPGQGISGAGISGYIPAWSGANSLGNSYFSDNGRILNSAFFKVAQNSFIPRGNLFSVDIGSPSLFQVGDPAGPDGVVPVDLRVTGSLQVTGSKNARVLTDNFNGRLLYSYEEASPRFGDEGAGELKDGMAKIILDPVFLETIEKPFFIHLTAFENNSQPFAADISGDYFVVKSGNGSKEGKFFWMLTAPRKGYSTIRLQEAD